MCFGFKITLKIALQASHTVRQAITPLLLDGYTACTDIQEIHARSGEIGHVELRRTAGSVGRHEVVRRYSPVPA